jgi:hypothetical protein
VSVEVNRQGDADSGRRSQAIDLASQSRAEFLTL